MSQTSTYPSLPSEVGWRKVNLQILQIGVSVEATLNIKNQSHRNNQILVPLIIWWLHVGELAILQPITLCGGYDGGITLVESLDQHGLNRPKHLWYSLSDFHDHLGGNDPTGLIITGTRPLGVVGALTSGNHHTETHMKTIRTRLKHIHTHLHIPVSFLVP